MSRGIIEALAIVCEGQPNTCYLTISYFVCAAADRIPFEKKSILGGFSFRARPFRGAQIRAEKPIPSLTSLWISLFGP